MMECQPYQNPSRAALAASLGLNTEACEPNLHYHFIAEFRAIREFSEGRSALLRDERELVVRAARDAVTTQTPGLYDGIHWNGWFLHYAIIRGIKYWGLHLLVRKNRRALYGYTTSINGPDGRDTPLHLFLRRLRRDHTAIFAEIVELLTVPAALLHQNIDGDLPLHLLLQERLVVGDERIAMYLLAYYSQQGLQSLRVRNKRGQLPLHVLFNRSVLNNDLFPLIKHMVAGYPAALGELDESGWSPMHWASSKLGHPTAPQERTSLDVFDFLVNAYPEALGAVVACMLPWNVPYSFLGFPARQYPRLATQANNAGLTPVHLVCRYPCAITAGCLEVLLPVVPVAVLHQPDESGKTAFHYLCMGGAPPNVLHYALDRFPIAAFDACDNEGRTGLHLALEAKHEGTVKALAASTPETAQHQDNRGRTPLHVALEDYVTNVGTRDHATRQKRTFYRNVVAYLLDAYAGAVQVRNAEGTTPLEYACENNVDVSIIYQLILSNPTANFGNP